MLIKHANSEIMTNSVGLTSIITTQPSTAAAGLVCARLNDKQEKTIKLRSELARSVLMTTAICCSRSMHLAVLGVVNCFPGFHP